MFIIIIIITVLLTWKYADWKNWEKYHSTMLFFSLGNLLYNFVYHDHFLWKFKPDILNHHIMEVIFSFTVFPLLALLFISTLPKGFKGCIIHIAKFVTSFIVTEFILYIMGRIEYNYGWNIWWSLLWNSMMFPIFILHHKKPLFAYASSVILIFGMHWIFPYRLN